MNGLNCIKQVNNLSRLLAKRLECPCTAVLDAKISKCPLKGIATVKCKINDFNSRFKCWLFWSELDEEDIKILKEK